MHLRAGHVDPVLQLLHHLLPDGYRFGLQARTAVLRLVRIPRDHCRRGSDASEQRAGEAASVDRVAGEESASAASTLLHDGLGLIPDKVYRVDHIQSGFATVPVAACQREREEEREVESYLK